MREETDRQRIDEYNDMRGYSLKSPVTSALSEVFESVGEGVTFWGGCLRGKADAIDRLKTRISLKPGQHSLYSMLIGRECSFSHSMRPWKLRRNFAPLSRRR